MDVEEAETASVEGVFSQCHASSPSSSKETGRNAKPELEKLFSESNCDVRRIGEASWLASRWAGL